MIVLEAAKSLIKKIGPCFRRQKMLLKLQKTAVFSAAALFQIQLADRRHVLLTEPLAAGLAEFIFKINGHVRPEVTSRSVL